MLSVADLGAIQNRFETTVKNLQVSSENLTASNSRIRDADFASETAELSRARVLQQGRYFYLGPGQRPAKPGVVSTSVILG